ncbi:MAG TPA: PilZ domain-containing protein [Candidatus Angelobacter sp.]|jgi:hypothetical protein|nr:PilZ domain-containing protein [Candidatus Angelobacter sp.]
MRLRNVNLRSQVQRAHGIMLASQLNKRCNPRSMVIFPISITGEDGTEKHSGIVRDISKDGLFFYSNFKPQLQEIITFVLHMSNNKVACTGEVVRIEEKAPGAAVGVAVKIHSSSEQIA